MRAEQIELLLPTVVRATAAPGTPLRALMQAMEGMLLPVDERLVGIDTVFDPRRTPADFVPVLADWLALRPIYELKPAVPSLQARAPELALPRGRLRELAAQAAQLARVRGTLAGLERMLEVATGLRPFAIREGFGDREFHIHVQAPNSARAQAELVERIVGRERPAHVTYEIDYGEASPAREST